MSRVIVFTFGACALATGLYAAQSAPAVATSSVASPTRTAPRLLPGTRVNVFATIQGDAIDAVNAKLPNTLVRLRDARMGRVVDTSLTNKAGLFTFYRVDPGYYIVELFDNNQRTLAATQLIGASAGETKTAVVKLPFQSSMLSNLFLMSGAGGNGERTGAGPAPQAVLESIPAVVPAGDPVSER
jgi:hypothetical protein